MMIEKVLNVASFENGMIRLVKTDIDINELITEISSVFEIHVNHRGGKIIKDLEASHPIIPGDREHLTQVIFNLLDNANKYSREEPVITISTRLDQESQMMNIVVSDQGIGISEDHLKDIFKPFNRISNNQMNHRGFGLGLPYVAEVAKLHSGEIHIQSRLNAGSSFTLKLPLS
jgi:two-component system phosphate regulon sensor histidine kinase PhoR